MKRIIFIILILFSSSNLYASKNFGVGFHFGAQHDAGSVASYYPDAKYEPQNIAIVGISLYIQSSLFFIRTGGDTTFTINQGKVLEDTSNVGIKKYSVQYTGVPAFIGLRFPLEGRGAFYLGGGISYLFASGKLTLNDDTKHDIEDIVFATGFIAGMQLDIDINFSLYMEWMYLDGRTKPIIASGNASNPLYKDIFIDYTGHKIILGIVYYAI